MEMIRRKLYELEQAQHQIKNKYVSAPIFEEASLTSIGTKKS